MSKPLTLLGAAVALALLAACAHIDITKTGKGYFPPTNPNNVDILMTVPQRQYTELATLTITGYKIREEAKMHNAIRAKAAPAGANAVIIQQQGITDDKRWATGVAVRYQ